MENSIETQIVFIAVLYCFALYKKPLFGDAAILSGYYHHHRKPSSHHSLVKGEIIREALITTRDGMYMMAMRPFATLEKKAHPQNYG